MPEQTRTYDASYIMGFSALSMGDEFEAHFRNRDFYHINSCNDLLAVSDSGNTSLLGISYRLVFEGVIENPEANDPRLAFAKGSANAYVIIAEGCTRLPDAEFRARFSMLLRAAARDIQLFLINTMNVTIRHRLPIDVMEDVLQCYLSLTSPLPPAPFEHESNPFAPNYTGITVDGPFVLCYYIYFANAGNARNAGRRLCDLGFKVRVSKAQRGWLCRAEVATNTNGPSDEAVRSVSEVSTRFNGEFDGWDAGPRSRHEPSAD